MSFGEAIQSVFSKYATFSGRARRSEFWYFILFYILVSIVVSIIARILPRFGSVMNFIVTLGFFLPTLAVTVRRFHDIGKSGWTYLYFLIPSFLFFVYMIYFVIKTALPYIKTGYDVDADFMAELLVSNNSSLAIIGALMFVSFVAFIIFIVCMAKDSEPCENKWGPNPKTESQHQY